MSQVCDTAGSLCVDCFGWRALESLAHRHYMSKHIQFHSDIVAGKGTSWRNPLDVSIHCGSCDVRRSDKEGEEGSEKEANAEAQVEALVFGNAEEFNRHAMSGEEIKGN